MHEGGSALIMQSERTTVEIVLLRDVCQGKAEDRLEDALQQAYTIRQELLGLSEAGRRTGVGAVMGGRSSGWRTGISLILYQHPILSYLYVFKPFRTVLMKS